MELPQRLPAGTSPPPPSVLALAVPAAGALVAEPLFLLADSAVVGRLGTVPLAGLGAAGALLTAIVGCLVFLAYGTTASVARQMGAGRPDAALRQGMDGLWLATALGTVSAFLGWWAADPLVSLVDPAAPVAEQAVTYLRWSSPGLPGTVVVLAATGVLRGLLDTRTPLVVAGTGAGTNALLNLALVHGLGLGIRGSAAGTAVVQTGMAVALTTPVLRRARERGVPRRPGLSGILSCASAGVPLLVRTLALRAVMILTASVAAAQGPACLAAHQVAMTIWTLLALCLDALAIAAQTLTGLALGRGDPVAARALVSRLRRWGGWGGAVLGFWAVAVGWVSAPLFSADPAVRHDLRSVLLLVAVTQPLCGFVFVLDGVLIGAGDGRYLAKAALFQSLCYLPAAVAVLVLAPRGTVGLLWLWGLFTGGYMLLRGVFLWTRTRGSRWSEISS